MQKPLSTENTFFLSTHLQRRRKRGFFSCEQTRTSASCRVNREGFGMKNKTFYQFKRAVPFCMSSPYRFVWLCVVFIMISCNYQQQCCSGLLVFSCFLHTSGKPHTLLFPTFDLVFGFVLGRAVSFHCFQSVIYFGSNL